MKVSSLAYLATLAALGTTVWGDANISIAIEGPMSVATQLGHLEDMKARGVLDETTFAAAVHETVVVGPLVNSLAVLGALHSSSAISVEEFAVAKGVAMSRHMAAARKGAPSQPSGEKAAAAADAAVEINALTQLHETHQITDEEFSLMKSAAIGRHIGSRVAERKKTVDSRPVSEAAASGSSNEDVVVGSERAEAGAALEVADTLAAADEAEADNALEQSKAEQWFAEEEAKAKSDEDAAAKSAEEEAAKAAEEGAAKAKAAEEGAAKSNAAEKEAANAAEIKEAVAEEWTAREREYVEIATDAKALYAAEAAVQEALIAEIQAVRERAETEAKADDENKNKDDRGAHASKVFQEYNGTEATTSTLDSLPTFQIIPSVETSQGGDTVVTAVEDVATKHADYFEAEVAAVAGEKESAALAEMEGTAASEKEATTAAEEKKAAALAKLEASVASEKEAAKATAEKEAAALAELEASAASEKEAATAAEEKKKAALAEIEATVAIKKEAAKAAEDNEAAAFAEKEAAEADEKKNSDEDANIQMAEEAADQTARDQAPTANAKSTATAPTSDEGQESNCVGWRQTGGCTAQGPREAHSDRGCLDEVAAGASGYCECGGGRRAAESTCDHGPFQCAAICAATCQGWRQTGGCAPTGPREASSDVPCDQEVPAGASGYCECAGGRRAAESDCDHGPFMCAMKCTE
jgi:hypothetical protein